MKQLYIDIGSATVKIYSVLDSNVELLETKSLPFKKSIDPEVGLAETVKQELIDYVNSVKTKYQASRVKVFSTFFSSRLICISRLSSMNSKGFI